MRKFFMITLVAVIFGGILAGCTQPATGGEATGGDPAGTAGATGGEATGGAPGETR